MVGGKDCQNRIFNILFDIDRSRLLCVVVRH